MPYWKTSLIATCGLVLLIGLLDRLSPPPLRPAGGAATVVLAADGTPLRAFADRRGIWRSPIRLDQVSPLYVEALLNYEDRRFFDHPGVDPRAMVRAIGQWLENGRVVSGGSTLTMQVARLLEEIPHDLGGKLWQVARALQLEWRLSKQQILELYLAIAPFGGPIEGVEAASQAYLGKTARNLSHAEAALLAALPQAPSRNRPDRHPGRARAMRDKALERMADLGVWPRIIVDEAKQESVAVFFETKPLLAPLLARRLRAGGESVVSTLDARLQNRLQDRLRGYAGLLPPRTSAALLVVRNRDLATLAYLGSADFADDARFGHVDMVRAVRSPGSTLKPFLYGLAIEEGLIHSHSLLIDAPLEIDGYRPGNFSGRFHGPVSAAAALRQSLNVPAVDLLDRLGPAWFDARLRHAGLKLHFGGDAKPNPAMILGGVGSNLEDLVGAYRALAAAGLAGKVRLTPEQPLEERRLLDPGAAWIIRRILATAEVPREIGYTRRRDIAWKTGTSYGFRDAWAIGVDQDHTVGVWIGRPDGTPVPGQYGAVSAVPLLFRVFDSLERSATLVSGSLQPERVATVEICWPLGTAAESQPAEHCHRRHSAWILDRQIPPTLPERHPGTQRSGLMNYQTNPESGLRVDARCRVNRRENRTLARWPLASLPWLSGENRATQKPPPFDPACPADTSTDATALRLIGVDDWHAITAPGNGDLPLITLKALGGGNRLYWLVDEQLVQTTGSSGVFKYRLPRPGTYRVSVFDTAGNQDSVQLRFDEHH